MNLMDVKSTKRAFDEIKKVSGKISFICIFTDSSSKIAIFSLVTKEMQSKIKANEWVNSVLFILGGNGGGKSNIAQGNAMFNESLMKIAIENANKYCDDRI
jgi:alanyl-tRNA synthetase